MCKNCDKADKAYEKARASADKAYEKAIAPAYEAFEKAIATFLGLHGYKLDFHNPKVISQHIASKTAEEIDKQVADGTTYRLLLGHSAKTITGEMKQKASAWVDKSKNVLEIETNDLLYEQMLLEMPLRVINLQDGFTNLTKSLKEYDKQIKLHLTVLKGIEKAINTLNDKNQHIKKKNIK